MLKDTNTVDNAGNADKQYFSFLNTMHAKWRKRKELFRAQNDIDLLKIAKKATRAIERERKYICLCIKRQKKNANIHKNINPAEE